MKPVKAKKSLGQNFLKDESVIGEILAVAEVGPRDRVFEVGPGTGALTERLVGRVAQYVALEIDRVLAERLRKQFADSKKVAIMTGDVLEVHLEAMLRQAGYEEHPYKIIANIPYYITAPIIRRLLALTPQPLSLTLMVQDEVATRLSARPGSMSLLSLMAQYYAAVEKRFFVPKDAFEPVPKVDSAIVSIVPKRRYDPAADKKIFGLARAGFAAKRKTLANNLAASCQLPRETVNARLQKAGLPADIRAQALSVEDWERLVSLWPA